jgi:transposase InsO family protein
VDAFTGWLSLSAHAHKDAETIAKGLTEDAFWKFGLPEVLRTDNGTEFRNGTTRAIAHLLQIRHSTTTPYTPQANGKAETRNKTIYDLLVSMCKDDPMNQRKWDEFLPVVAWAYNTTVNHATGFTPFRALFGREARSPSDSWIEDFATHFNTNIFDYVTRITESLRHVWDLIATRTMEERDRVAANYEENQSTTYT